MDYGRIAFHTVVAILAVAVGFALAGTESAVVGLIYLAILGLLGVAVNEVFEEIYFYLQGKVLAYND